MCEGYGIVSVMKLFVYSRKLVYDTETTELITFEEFEKQKENNEEKIS
jgi:hypothetical protein